MLRAGAWVDDGVAAGGAESVGASPESEVPDGVACAARRASCEIVADAALPAAIAAAISASCAVNAACAAASPSGES